MVQVDHATQAVGRGNQRGSMAEIIGAFAATARSADLLGRTGGICQRGTIGQHGRARKAIAGPIVQSAATVVCRTGIGAVAHHHLAAFHPVEGEGHAGASTETRDKRGVMLVGPGHVAALPRELEAIIGLAQDDVDDTGHGIGTIDGRGPILEHLDAFHGRKRDAVQVHESLVDVQ